MQMMQTILVIEDDRAIRGAVVDILEMEDYRVLSAEDGLVGVALARAERPTLIVCDIMMPFLDGYGVLTELRKNPDTATIPFIFLTARTTTSDVRQGMNLGADDYLTKPFRAEELLRTVQTRIERQARLAEKLQTRVDNLHQNLMSFLPHELNTPLHGILAGVEFLRDEYAELQPSDVEELLWIIHQSALRMRRLVTNSLLHADLAAMQNGSGQKDAAKAAPLYVAATIRQTVEQEAKAVVRQEDTQAEIAEGTVHIQPYYLAKIVEEIVNNAYGFSKAGTPVEIVARPVEGAYVMTVKDRGRGMSQEEIAEISAFRQFQRQQYEQQGLGLGLAISQQLLILNGGTMNIDSTPGQGTQVQIILPLAG